jgi:anti-sigma-K factor RskA
MSPTTPTHDEIFADLPLYALGALDPDEADAIASHIATCPRCERELASLDQTVSVLGAAVPEHEPPDDLRARVLSSLAPTAVAAPEPIRPPANVRRLPTWVRVGFAVAAALILMLAGATALTYRELSDTRSTLQAQQDQQIAERELLAHPARTVAMVAAGAAQSYGTLYVGETEHQAVMVIDDLPPTPAGQVYQIWLVRGDGRESAGVFTVDQSGSARMLITAPQPLTSYQALGITAEPGPDGSPEPTSPRLIGCPLV